MIKVLIVDDAAFMRMSLKTILKQNGYEVVGEADNGLAGVQKYKELKPDIVTMDITMPVMDGIQAIKEIKKHNPDAKMVVISAMGQEPMVREAISSGAKGFIIKPFTEEFVVTTLSKIK